MIHKSIVSIIASYAFEYTDCLDWIDLKKRHYGYLSENPNAINILETNLDKVDWVYLNTIL